MRDGGRMGWRPYPVRWQKKTRRLDGAVLFRGRAEGAPMPSAAQPCGGSGAVTGARALLRDLVGLAAAFGLAALAGFAEAAFLAVGAAFTAFAGAAVAIAVLVWLALRLSMAAPMTFADNQFRLFESWALTKGQGWRLLGVALLVVVFVIGVEILIGAVLLGTVFAAGGSLAALHGEAGFEAFMARPPLAILRDVWPWATVIGVIGALFSAVVQAIFYAPWAAVHRALTSEA